MKTALMIFFASLANTFLSYSVLAHCGTILGSEKISRFEGSTWNVRMPRNPDSGESQVRSAVSDSSFQEFQWAALAPYKMLRSMRDRIRFFGAADNDPVIAFLSMDRLAGHLKGYPDLTDSQMRRRLRTWVNRFGTTLDHKRGAHRLELSPYEEKFLWKIIEDARVGKLVVVEVGANQTRFLSQLADAGEVVWIQKKTKEGLPDGMSHWRSPDWDQVTEDIRIKREKLNEIHDRLVDALEFARTEFDQVGPNWEKIKADAKRNGVGLHGGVFSRGDRDVVERKRDLKIKIEEIEKAIFSNRELNEYLEAAALAVW